MLHLHRHLAQSLTLVTAVAAACGSSGDESGFSGGTSIQGAGGTGGHPTSSSSSSGTTSAAGGAGGSAPLGKGPPYPIVLAHGFFGFEKFAGLDFLTYFYQVKDNLAQNGETEVYTPSVDPFNDSDVRGAQLAKAISDILTKTGYAKVNLIGHSQGGLDARVVAHDHPEMIASVTTIAAPHHGTPIADVAMKLLSDPNEQAVIDWFAQQLGGPLYDKIGNTTSLAKPLILFSQPGIAAFNAKYPDADGIPYYSLSGRSNYASDDAFCKPDLAVAFTSDFIATLDPLDGFFSITEPIMSGGFANQHPNDGLVRVEDARWGTFLGCVPADHLDEVGQLFGDSPGSGNFWDYQEMYRQLVMFLRMKGY